MDRFTIGYVEALFWAEPDNADPDSDASLLSLGYGVEDLTAESLAEIAADCEDFQTSFETDLEACGLTPEQQGADFYFTRQRHGVGFWDRDYRPGPAREALLRLTEAAHGYGSIYAAVDGARVVVV